MLKHLQKLFAGQPAPTAQADNVEEVNMENQEGTVTPVANSGTVDVASLTASLQTANESLADVSAKLAKAEAQIAELTSIVTQAAEFKAAEEQAALVAKLAARKEKAVLAVGTEKAETLMTATTGMDDASFNAVLAVTTTTLSTEANSNMFTEKGVEGNADTTAVQSNKTMEILQAKYCKTSTTK